jgi:hypothetical protein
MRKPPILGLVFAIAIAASVGSIAFASYRALADYPASDCNNHPVCIDNTFAGWFLSGSTAVGTILLVAGYATARTSSAWWRRLVTCACSIWPAALVYLHWIWL